VEIEFDPAKDFKNRLKHGKSLGEAEAFDWKTAQIETDSRHDYSEQRFRATGFIADRLHAMVFCVRDEAARIISLRKANPREVKNYANQD
jgi:uncharacterized protein